MTGRRLKRISRHAAVVALGLLLSFVAAEALVRTVASFDARVRNLAAPRGRDDWRPVTAAEYVESRPDALIPHDNYFGYRRNRFGFNDREPEDEPAAGAFRIVALGDSFTFGVVAYPRAYMTTAEAVATLFTRGAPRVVVYNLGVPGTGVADYRRVFELFGRELKPDLAIVTLYLGNDLLDFPGWHAPREGSGAGFRSWFLTFATRVWRIHSEAGAFNQREARGASRVGDAPDFSDDGRTFGQKRFSDDAWARIVDNEVETFRRGPDQETRMGAFLAELDGLRLDLSAAHVPMGVVLAPSRLQIERGDLDSALERAGLTRDDVDLDAPAHGILKWARENHVPAFDLTPIFRSHDVGRSHYQPNDTHWNIGGNDLAGFEVGRWLVSSGLVAGENDEVGGSHLHQER